MGVGGRGKDGEVERVRRIHALIAAAIDTTDTDRLEQIMTELRAALKDHIRRLRVLAAEKLAPGA